MDNTTPVPNLTTSPVAQSPIPQNKPKKKIFIGVAAVVTLLVILITVIFFMTKNNKKLVIGDTEIPSEEMNLIEDYYLRDGTEDKNAVSKFVSDLYTENIILKKALEENSITFADLSNEITELENVNKATRDYPDNLNKVLAENTVMKRHLLRYLGIKSRSGEIIQLEVPMEKQTETPGKDYSQLMQSKLSLYKQLVDGGISWENVKARIESDPQLQPDSDVSMRIFAFEDMTPMFPVFIKQEFVDTVFSTEVDSTSQIFNVGGKNTLTYGIAYVTAAGEGEFADYGTWLESKKKALTIEEK